MKPFAFFLLAAALSFASCQKPDWSRSEVRTMLEGNNWRISSLIDRGEDVSSAYNEVELRFENNRRLIVIDGDQEYEGIWRLRRNLFDDDGLLELDVDFNGSNFNSRTRALEQDWYLLEMDGTELFFDLTDAESTEQLRLQAL